MHHKRAAHRRRADHRHCRLQQPVPGADRRRVAIPPGRRVGVARRTPCCVLEDNTRDMSLPVGKPSAPGRVGESSFENGGKIGRLNAGRRQDRGHLVASREEKHIRARFGDGAQRRGGPCDFAPAENAVDAGERHESVCRPVGMRQQRPAGELHRQGRPAAIEAERSTHRQRSPVGRSRRRAARRRSLRGETHAPRAPASATSSAPPLHTARKSETARPCPSTPGPRRRG